MYGYLATAADLGAAETEGGVTLPLWEVLSETALQAHWATFAVRIESRRVGVPSGWVSGVGLLPTQVALRPSALSCARYSLLRVVLRSSL